MSLWIEAPLPDLGTVACPSVESPVNISNVLNDRGRSVGGMISCFDRFGRMKTIKAVLSYITEDSILSAFVLSRMHNAYTKHCLATFSEVMLTADQYFLNRTSMASESRTMLLKRELRTE